MVKILSFLENISITIDTEPSNDSSRYANVFSVDKDKNLSSLNRFFNHDVIRYDNSILRYPKMTTCIGDVITDNVLHVVVCTHSLDRVIVFSRNNVSDFIRNEMTFTEMRDTVIGTDSVSFSPDAGYDITGKWHYSKPAIVTSKKMEN